MSDMRFFGSYAIFDTVNKSEGAVMMGADHLIGMRYSIDFRVEDGKTTAWVVNPFGKAIGYYDDQVTYRLDVMRARGWNLYAVLSLVGMAQGDEEGDDGGYWGETALFGCPTRYSEEVERFIGRVTEQLIDGVRPDIDLTSSSIDLMLEEKGDWLSDKKAPEPKDRGVIVKKTRSLSEKAIEKGREGNIGCYIVSWAFIIVVVGAIVLGVKTLLGL